MAQSIRHGTMEVQVMGETIAAQQQQQQQQWMKSELVDNVSKVSNDDNSNVSKVNRFHSLKMSG